MAHLLGIDPVHGPGGSPEKPVMWDGKTGKKINSPPQCPAIERLHNGAGGNQGGKKLLNHREHGEHRGKLV
jgi:hypothetical protein